MTAAERRKSRKYSQSHGVEENHKMTINIKKLKISNLKRKIRVETSQFGQNSFTISIISSPKIFLIFT